jgi:hypothetical protein
VIIEGSIMEIKNAKNRSSEKRESGHIRDSEGHTRIMGSTAPDGSEFGNDQIRVSGENSQQANSLVSGAGTNGGIPGKIVSQLIKETERQLAYHRTQASELETRLHELHQLTEELHQDDKTEH